MGGKYPLVMINQKNNKSEKLNNIINMVDMGYALFSVTREESITQRTFTRNNQILGYKINVNKIMIQITFSDHNATELIIKKIRAIKL